MLKRWQRVCGEVAFEKTFKSFFLSPRSVDEIKIISGPVVDFKTRLGG